MEERFTTLRMFTEGVLGNRDLLSVQLSYAGLVTISFHHITRKNIKKSNEQT